MGDSDLIGVHIHRSDILKTDHFLRLPSISVYLFNRKNGNLWSRADANEPKNQVDVEPVTSKPYDVIENRTIYPQWNEILRLNENISALSSDSQILIMFELTDVVQQRKTNKFDRVRIAWAFLSPHSSDGSSNIDKEVRLQLYKPRKSCKLSHQTCSIFHLYSKHELKRLQGSLFITIKGIRYTSDGRTESKETEPESQESEEKSSAVENPSEAKPVMKIYQWSRLPSQSCKIPNQIYKKFNIGSNGASVVRFSKTGSYVAVACVSRILICDAASGEELASLTGHNGLVYELDWSDNDSFLMSVSGDCSSAIWSINPLHVTPLFILPHPSFVYCGKWFGSNENLVTGCKDHVIRFWSKSDDGFDLVEEVTGHPGFVTALATQGTSILFSGDSVGCIMIRKFSNNKWHLIKQLTLDELSHNAIDSIHLHLSQRRILITLRTRGSFMIDTTAGVIIQSYKGMVNMCARSISCLSPCGSLLFSFCQNGEVCVWEVNTGKLLATYENLFPIHRLTEVSACIHYHPFEHMITFAVLGRNHPALILKYSESKYNDSKKIGLVFKSSEANKIANESNALTNALKNEEPLISFSMNEKDKLASLVKNIDKVFTLNRNGKNDWSM